MNGSISYEEAKIMNLYELLELSNNICSIERDKNKYMEQEISRARK